MADKQTKVVHRGVGFWSLLGLLFIALKLCGVIEWPWLLVLLPIYGPIAMALVFVAGVVMAFAMAGLAVAAWESAHGS